MPLRNMDHSRSTSPSRIKTHESGSLRRFSLHHGSRRSVSSIISTNSDIVETDTISATSPLNQTIGLRTKKYLIPRLLSNRKLALSVLHPLSASLMNDIHYLLKVSRFWFFAESPHINKSISPKIAFKSMFWPKEKMNVVLKNICFSGLSAKSEIADLLSSGSNPISGMAKCTRLKQITKIVKRKKIVEEYTLRGLYE
ncbi:hypothetical protein ACTXT7_000555 [Hymenolepis weldensis]